MLYLPDDIIAISLAYLLEDGVEFKLLLQEVPNKKRVFDSIAKQILGEDVSSRVSRTFIRVIHGNDDIHARFIAAIIVDSPEILKFLFERSQTRITIWGRDDDTIDSLKFGNTVLTNGQFNIGRAFNAASIHGKLSCFRYLVKRFPEFDLSRIRPTDPSIKECVQEHLR